MVGRTQSYILILLFFVSGLPLGIHAQYFETGQEPASVNWKQINTDNFQIIFPKEYEAKAQRIANILDTVYYLDTQSLQAKPKKISLVLHTTTSNSNAYVAWAPKRMEFFTTPPQNSYPQRWLQQLGLHEYRHVVQITKVRTGLTRILSFILGQQGTAGIIGLYIPPWFLEGDAVLAETEFSHSGRGRVPDFEMRIRTQVLEKGLYSYDKAVFGSYRDFVPSHYELGYQLVAYGRKNYGSGIWNNALDNTGKRPYAVTPFSQGIRHSSGLQKTKFYRTSIQSLRQAWEKQLLETRRSDHQLIRTSENDFYTNYRLPSLINEKKYISLKSGMEDINRIVSNDDAGNEQILFTPGAILPDALSYADSMLAWTEYKSHPRWEARSFSNIKVLDLRTGKLRQITNDQNLFAPAFSSKGDRIAVVKTDPSGKFSISILNSSDGKTLQEITSEENYFFQLPSWYHEDNKLIAIVVGDYGKKIVSIDLESGKLKDISKYSWEEISVPIVVKDKVFYIGSASGISDIYAIDLGNGRQYRVFSSAYGVADLGVSQDGESLIYSLYTADGYRPAITKIEDLQWVPKSGVQNSGPQLYKHIIGNKDIVLEEASIAKRKYPVEKYSRLKNLFRFHSWAPFYIDVDQESFAPGVTIMSQNTLSTAFTTLGWDYDLNEESGKYRMNFTYKGWFPVVDIEADFSRRQSSFSDTNGVLRKVRWYETNITTGISSPLNLTNGKYFQGLTPKISLTQKFLRRDESAEVTVHETSINILNFQVFYYHQIRRSLRDIYPRWGQRFELNYRQSVFKAGYDDRLISTETYLYFPGFIRHQGLRIYGGSQWIRGDNYTFSNLVSVSRGFSGIFANDLYSAKLDYIMPLFSPDLSISSLIYLKRISLGLFYDYTYAQSEINWMHYISTGMELRTEMHILRTIAPVEIGVRGIYLPEYNETRAELLFAINFGALY